MSSTRKLLAATLAMALGVSVAACSSDGTSDGGAATTGSATSTTSASAATDRPDGPSATVDRELTAGSTFIGTSRSIDLDAAGYEQHEYQVSGSATAYAGDQPANGEWDLAPTGEPAVYTTRIVVRRPADASTANGSVVVEWLNVSGGVDADPDFGYLSDEILRSGTTWVGVSAQHIGIEGGPTAVQIGGDNALIASVQGKGLKAISPERYGELSHPGDSYSYDLYSQVARTVWSNEAGILGDLDPTHVVAIGESQSAFALTTYADGVQPLTKLFDGFFIHSRGGAALPLAGDGPSFDIAGSIGGVPTKIRTDLDVPVLMFQTESDVAGLLGYLPARQDDTDLIRTWEVAGAAHVDRFLLGEMADASGCEPPVNDGPQQHLVGMAALRSLLTWIDDGTVPPTSPRLVVDDAGAYERDDDGIVLGGIRTPVVDVPVDVLSGESAPGASVFCLLAGGTTPLTAEQLAARYDSAEDYEQQFEASTDEAIDAGFVLADDRDTLLDAAQPDRIAS